MLRLRAVGLYHDLDFKDHQQEFSAPFEQLPPGELMTHMPLKVNEVFIAPNIEKLTQNYDTLHDMGNYTISVLVSYECSMSNLAWHSGVHDWHRLMM